MKKVLFIIAPDKFRDEEYFQSKVMIQAKGLEILTAAVGDPEEVTGIKGGKARPDVIWQDMSSLEVDGIVVIGGEGSNIYLNDKYLQQVLKQFADQGKTIGAICMAPAILAKAGLLVDKNATADQGVHQIMQDNGAKLQSKDLVTDGNIITAESVSMALKFGKLVSEMVVAA